MTLTGRLLADEGRVMAMKGQIDAVELAEIPQGYQIEQRVELAVPGLKQEQRHLLVIGRDNAVIDA